jgi:hypothetical protein
MNGIYTAVGCKVKRAEPFASTEKGYHFSSISPLQSVPMIIKADTLAEGLDFASMGTI